MTHNLLMRFIYAPKSEEDLCDGIYRVVDSWFRRGMFYKADDLMRGLDLSRMSTLTILAVLSITSSAIDRLWDRPDYAKRVRAHLTQTEPGRVDDLLRGLE